MGQSALTGLLISELVNIKINDIRLEEGIIHIMGKGSKERIVIIGKETAQSLRNYLDEMDNRKKNIKSYLFPALRVSKNSTKRSIAWN